MAKREILDFDPDDLELGEAEAFEELAGVSIMRFVEAVRANGGVPTAKMVTAIAYVFGKRADPGLTISAARALKYRDLLALLPMREIDEPDPDGETADPNAESGPEAATDPTSDSGSPLSVIEPITA